MLKKVKKLKQAPKYSYNSPEDWWFKYRYEDLFTVGWDEDTAQRDILKEN